MIKSLFSKLSVVLGIYSFILAVYSVFSYSLTDPNLVIIKWKPFLHFQQWMWQTFFHNAQLLTITYIAIIIALFIVYWRIIVLLKQSSVYYQKSSGELLGIYLLLVAPLFFSYNALSHDVFNYMFNAKMVLEFQANPHVRVALDFAYDPWLRFMHNTHTPAPYGYGWTAVSLLPYLLGMGKFLSTWLAFRLWAVLSLVATYYALLRLARANKQVVETQQLAFVFLNPLIVIEIISNMHNDLWMIAPAILALSFLLELSPGKKNQIWTFLLSLGLFGFSISIKWATLALLPLVILIITTKLYLFKFAQFAEKKLSNFATIPVSVVHFFEQKIYTIVPLCASILLFLPLLTSRSQYFLPWYLSWALLWVVLIENRTWKKILLIFSISALLRYVPWLWTGGFDGNVILYQRIYTFAPACVLLIYSLLRQLSAMSSSKITVIR
ncbi:hypothetical protein KA082_00205 [Candidatus Woesebacteria bacterium]|nr:hypothetical protein [Candidatus Woesebacteria bacterium]